MKSFRRGGHSLAARYLSRLAQEAEGAGGRLATISIASTPLTVSLPLSEHVRNKHADD
jgi:hypothetical protein